MHREFQRFLDELKRHAESHLSTWRLARVTDPEPWVLAEIAFWKGVIRYINMLHYYGVRGHGIARRTRRPQGDR